MKQIFTVFAFTLKDAIRKKAFIISTAIILVLIIGGSAALAIFMGGSDDGNEAAGSSSSSSSDNTAESPNGEADSADGKKVCYYLDEHNILPGAAQALTVLYDVKEIKAAEKEDIVAQIKEDKNISLLEVSAKNSQPLVTVYSKDFMSGAGANISAVSQIINEVHSMNVLVDSGVDPDLVILSRQPVQYATVFAGEMNTSAYIIGIVFTLLMFFAIYYYGYGVAMSVATEKTSRVMETLIVSAKPSRILLGKCFGMGVLGIIQFAMIVLTGGLCLKFIIPSELLSQGSEFSLSVLNAETAAVMFVYFVLGYSLFAVMNAVSGALVSKIEDLNSAMMPVMLLSMVGFYLGYFVNILSPGSGIVQKIAMYLPISSPFIVPSSMLSNSIEPYQVVISVLILAFSVVAVAALSVKIYSASVLHYGKKLKFKDAIKMSKQK